MILLNKYSIDKLIKYIKFEDLESLSLLLASHSECKSLIDREPSRLVKDIGNSFFINEAYSEYSRKMCEDVTLDLINNYFLEFDLVIGMINLTLLELATPREALSVANSRFINNVDDLESQIVFSGFECYILGRISTISCNYNGLLRELAYSKTFRNNAIHKSITLNNLRIFYMCEFISSCSKLIKNNKESLLKLLKTTHPSHNAFQISETYELSNFKHRR